MDIPYQVKRSRKRRKTIALQISEKAELIIHAPSFTPMDEIRRFVAEKQNWIERTIQRQRARIAAEANRQFANGETFYYLGEPHVLNVYSGPPAAGGVAIKNRCIFLNAPDNQALRKHFLTGWYKEKAKTIIPQRVDSFSRMMNLPYGNVKITSAQKRWGSCSARNDLSFSWRLVMTPPAVIDYVIVHELSHIKHKDHSARFWQQVQKIIPEHKTLRRWLKDHHDQLRL
jgi:predicted metal-dependent hydrolase